MEPSKIDHTKSDLSMAWEYVQMCMNYGMVIDVRSIVKQDPILAADLIIIKVMEFSKHYPDTYN